MENQPNIVIPSVETRQNEDGLWKTEDVADYLNAGVSTVYKWMKEEGLPSLRIGGALRFDPDAVKAWAKGRAA